MRSAGRLSRHHAINDIVRRAFVPAGVPVAGRPVPQQRGIRGKALIWDFFLNVSNGVSMQNRKINTYISMFRDIIPSPYQLFTSAALTRQNTPVVNIGLNIYTVHFTQMFTMRMD